MTVPVFPVAKFVSVGLPTLERAAALVRSPFTLTAQVQDWGGEAWVYQMEVALLAGFEARSLLAFLNGLGGPVGRFLLNEPSNLTKTGLGSPVVNGGGQTGNSLVTSGWGATGLKAGEFFSLGSDISTRLYQLTADVVPVAGAATLQFVPRLRSSPANASALAVTAPQVLLRLDGPVPGQIIRADKFSFSIKAREAI